MLGNLLVWSAPMETDGQKNRLYKLILWTFPKDMRTPGHCGSWLGIFPDLPGKFGVVLNGVRGLIICVGVNALKNVTEASGAKCSIIKTSPKPIQSS